MAGTTESKLEYLIRSKEDVRLAINRMLVPCPEDTPFLEYGPKIKQVDVDLSDATVTSDDVMEGVIAYDSKKQRLVGTIPDIGPLNFDPSDEEYIIPYGRTAGGKVNKADITKLAEYEACLRIANSVDNLDDYSNTTATAEDIMLGKTAYSNGEFIEGTLEAGNTTIDTTGMSATNSTNTIAAYITAIDKLDTSALKAGIYTFYCCKSLKRIPPLNTNNLTRMDYMFYNCNALQELNLLNTNKVIYMDYAFYGCSSLKTIQLTNTNKVTSFKYTFENCTSLESISGLNTESCRSFVNMFSGCTNLKATPLISFTQSGPANVNAVKMFNGCASLVDVSFYAPNNGYGGNCLRYMTDMFTGCSSLSDESLNNIMSLCVGTSVDTTPKTLKGIGLSLEQVTRCQSLSNYQALLNRGWTTGY